MLGILRSLSMMSLGGHPHILELPECFGIAEGWEALDLWFLAVGEGRASHLMFIELPDVLDV